MDFEEVKLYDQAMNPTAVIPVFHVQDVDASVLFYTEVLGFEQAFRYGTYVGLRLGKCELHICPPGDYGPRIGGGNAYFIGDEVDEYFKKIVAAGAKPKSEPVDQMYGMRDFVVLDPDGNQLSFGCDNERG
jgi:catechol 2,3-dioxygenase-like lactoylglutathione lyase family enzyme